MLTTSAYLVLGDPDTDALTECSDCGFDAVVAWPIRLMSINGMTQFGVYKACMRCWDDDDSQPEVRTL